MNNQRSMGDLGTVPYQTFNGTFGTKPVILSPNNKFVAPFNSKVGHFIGKEKREKVSKEIREAHFKLGFN